jgi:hypothetical protein
LKKLRFISPRAKRDAPCSDSRFASEQCSQNDVKRLTTELTVAVKIFSVGIEPEHLVLSRSTCMEREYLVNLKENHMGRNELHHFGCSTCKTMSTLQLLGQHASPRDAVEKAHALGLTEIDTCPLCLAEYEMLPLGLTAHPATRYAAVR